MIIYFSIRYRNPPLQRTTTVTPSISPLCACGCTQWARTWVLGSRPRVLFFLHLFTPQGSLEVCEKYFQVLKKQSWVFELLKTAKIPFFNGKQACQTSIETLKNAQVKTGFFHSVCIAQTTKSGKKCASFCASQHIFQKRHPKNGFFPVFLGFPKQHYNGLIYQESSNILSFQNTGKQWS